MRLKLAGLAVGTAIVMIAQSVAAMDNGSYEGPADGGWLSVMVQGKKFEIAVGNGSGGCGGSARGRITKSGKNHWTVTAVDGDQICKIDVMRQGSNRYNLEENRCTYFHGVSCSFSGFVTRRENNSSSTQFYIHDRSFGGYSCTDDCSGHKAGFEWAESNDVTDEDDCTGNSVAFAEGCRTYVDDPDRDADFDDDGNYVP